MLRSVARDEGGFVLIKAIMLVIVCTLVIAATIGLSRFGLNENKLDEEMNEAKQLGFSVLEQVKYEVSERFYNYYSSSPNAFTAHKLNWFDNVQANGTQLGTPGYSYQAPQSARFRHDEDRDTDRSRWRREGTYSVTVDVKQPDGFGGKFPGTSGARDLKVTVEARVGSSVRTFEEIVRYKISAGVFRYAYLQNQPMYITGGGSSLIFNGDIRSNGNLVIPDAGAVMAGDAYASKNPIFGDDGLGSITGGELTPVDLEIYDNSANTHDQARPVFTPNGPYVNGYTGAANKYPHEGTVEIPAKGDLDQYKAQAAESNGYIMQNGEIIVSQVYTKDQPGYDGIPDTPDDGTLVLDGSKGPIEVHGTVVIEGDAIIKGTFSGQGTVYTGRNIHIVGNVTYGDPPAWDKDGEGIPDDEKTADDDDLSEYESNNEKDLIGWVAKGNIIIGNAETNMGVLGPLFTAPNGHETDASDAENGYDSDGNPNNGFFFDGDYTATDGGDRIEIYERPEHNPDNPFYIPTWVGQYETKEMKKTEVYYETETVAKRVQVGTEQVWIEDGSISSGNTAGGYWEERPVYETQYVEEEVRKTRQVSYDPPRFEEVFVTTDKLSDRVPSDGEIVSRDDRWWLDTPDKDLISEDHVMVGDTITVFAYNPDGTVAGSITRTVTSCHNGGIKLNSPIPADYRGKEFRVTVAPRDRVYTDRHYYDPSITSKQLAELSGGVLPSHLDGVFFTNHLFGGKVDRLMVNGSVVTRDSGLRYSRAVFNWDIRLAEAKVDNDRETDTGLPKTFSDPVTLYRREL